MTLCGHCVLCQEIARFMQKQEMKSKRRSRDLDCPGSRREPHDLADPYDRRTARERQVAAAVFFFLFFFLLLFGAIFTCGEFIKLVMQQSHIKKYLLCIHFERPLSPYNH